MTAQEIEDCLTLLQEQLLNKYLTGPVTEDNFPQLIISPNGFEIIDESGSPIAGKPTTAEQIATELWAR